MKVRRLAGIVAVLGLVAVVIVGVVDAQQGAEEREEPVRTDRIETVGTFDFKPNSIIFSTLAYHPGHIEVSEGDTIEVVFGQADFGQEPHTLTIVDEQDLPRTADDVFACQACMEALEAHFAGELPEFEPDEPDLPETVPQPIVEVGEEGLDSPGDSLWFGPGETVEADVTASAGTTLHFVCALHPWMQGSITVTE